MTAITNECPYCRNADTLGAVYYDQNCVCCVKRMTAPPLCMCKDRPLAECPGEWEPGCDLGNNPKFVKAYVPRTPQPAGQEDMAAYAAIAANYKAAPKEPEPVAWGCFRNGVLLDDLVSDEASVDYWCASDEPEMQRVVKRALYTHPPCRVPMTEDEIKQVWILHDINDPGHAIIKFVRDIEKAHNIV